MSSAVRSFIHRIRSVAQRRPVAVTARSMGKDRTFRAWDLGDDTFIFEDGIWNHLEEHASVLIVQKADLARHATGFVLTISSGNHSTCAFPLLSGAFWKIARIASPRRGKVLMEDILCANVVNGKIEISQRDVSIRRLVTADGWLVESLHFGLDQIVMAERSDSALEHYRAVGQEWRVKPLAWTRKGMDAALAASRKKISTSLHYYHSAKGVHFLAYPDFHAMTELARADFDGFTACLRELVSVYEGNEYSFLRQPKFHGHHEIELFGLRRGVAEERIIPELEKLMEALVLRKVGPAGVPARIEAIDVLYRSQLTRPTLADSTSKDFVETLYMHLTGEIYAVMGEGSAPAFDDRRTALPGATFLNGRPQFHPGADERTRILLSNIRGLMSKDEIVDYANVYEVRTDDSDEAALAEPGVGKTREIVYKTNRRPLQASLVEKRLARHERDYGAYMLSRVEAFKALGVGFGDYRLLRHLNVSGHRSFDFYIRTRCAGEPSDDIPASYFQASGEFGGQEAGEDPQVVLALAALMGDAAAQNLAMKKYDAENGDCRFGVGKEIYEFGYDIAAMRVMPLRVSLCSVRGTLGWPCLDYTEENLNRVFDFYLGSYARTLLVLAHKHPSVDVAAQNLAMKKYDAENGDCRFGVGKEIYEFGYDIAAMRVMPLRVSLCSVRGTLGWPCLDYTEENLNRVFDFYLGSYARALLVLAHKHPSVDVAALGQRFFDGFSFRSRAMEWEFTIRREQFESFDPCLASRFGFVKKWRFALWSLERQVRRLDALRHDFLARLSAPAVPAATPAAPASAFDEPVIVLDDGQLTRIPQPAVPPAPPAPEAP